MKERLLIATEDFEVFNPRYDLENPTKIKKGQFIITNGGMPESFLLRAKVVEPLSTDENFYSVLKQCTLITGKPALQCMDFRRFANSKFIKDRFLEKNIKFPMFYWFADYEYKEVETRDIFGRRITLPVPITEKNKGFINDDNRLMQYLYNMIIGDE
ncbi:MAG: hypothetical protein J6J23_03915 [Clostridia bacterium]|nr:hypothetical protein [Clostridia bacterium]